MIKSILVQDLPQLLIQDKIDIGRFLMKHQTGEQEIQDFNSQEGLNDRCRLETLLSNPDLPIVGDVSLISSSAENFKCLFSMSQEIEEYIIKQNQQKECSRLQILQNLNEQNNEIP